MKHLALALPVAAALAFSPAARAGSNPFAGLYTSYNTSGTAIGWITCGTTSTSEGCFYSGALGPFRRACAFVATPEMVADTTETSRLAILDGGATATDPVTLDIYVKTDTLANGFDTTSFTLLQTLTLPLKAGAAASCQLAASHTTIYAGTGASINAAAVNIASGSIASVGGFSPPAYVSAITINAAGFVSVQFGTAQQATGFYLFNPAGALTEDGGGAAYLAPTGQGISLR